MPRKAFKVREDGSVAISDPNKTGEWKYDEILLAQAGAVPQSECLEHDTEEQNLLPMAASAVEAAYKAATAEALGAYFDAMVRGGFEWDLAQRILRTALTDLENKTKRPMKAIQDLFR